MYKAVYKMQVALAKEAKLSCQKDLFSLPETLHYLNCAFMSPLSKHVEAAGLKAVLRKSNPAQLSADDFFRETLEAKALFARLINAEAERIAIIPAASYGIATVAKNLKLEPGQNIILLAEQFPSNVYSWRNFQAQGITIKTIYPEPGAKRGESWNQRILEAIDPATAVIAMGHVHWTDGTLFDLEAIGKEARKVGAALIIDGTQSVGALAFDTEVIQPDALIVAGYKTMMTPYGIGCAYYGPRFDNAKPLEENWLSRKGSEDFSQLINYQDDYAAGMNRFDVGERSNFILMPMLIAALEDVLERQPERIQNYCHEISTRVLEQLSELAYHVEESRYRAKHLFGIRLPSQLDLPTLKDRLSEKNIQVSVRGTALRVAPNVYNDEADMAALYAVLKDVVT